MGMAWTWEVSGDRWMDERRKRIYIYIYNI